MFFWTTARTVSIIARRSAGSPARYDFTSVAPGTLIVPPPRSGQVDRLRVHELLDAERAELAAVAARFHAAERKARIGPHVVVDEHHPALELPRDALGAIRVARDHGG